MSKWFKVECIKYSTILVEVEDHEGIDDAIDVALNNGSWDEMETSEVETEFLETEIRHADEVEWL